MVLMSRPHEGLFMPGCGPFADSQSRPAAKSSRTDPTANSSPIRSLRRATSLMTSAHLSAHLFRGLCDEGQQTLKGVVPFRAPLHVTTIGACWPMRHPPVTRRGLSLP
jgi:hypothetical protein